MAIVEGKGCGTRRVVGFMPTNPCGLLLLPGFGVAAASGFAGFDYFQEVHVVGRIISGLVAEYVNCYSGSFRRKSEAGEETANADA